VLLVLIKSFYGRENPALTDELLAEAPAIFNWALEGLDRLNARGYFENPQSGADAIQQMEDLSSPVAAFVRDCCLVGPTYEVTVEALWKAWKDWSLSANQTLGSKDLFGRDLKAALPTIKRVRPRDEGDHRQYAYVGVGLKSSDYIGPDPGPVGPGEAAPPLSGPTGPAGPTSRRMYSSQEAEDAGRY
jgi:putative DNA primase/helicase